METAVIKARVGKDFRAEEIARSFLEASIGNTPLVRLRRIAGHLPENVEIFAKAEFLNPGGSVKDRAALAMIIAGEKAGLLTKGKTILDATSGNTGIAYAMIGAARGYKVTLALPKNASPERKRILKIYGAEIIETDAMNGTDGAQILAKELAAKYPDKYFIPINTTMKPTGKRITRRPRTKSGGRRTAKSRILSPVSERPELSSETRKD